MEIDERWLELDYGRYDGRPQSDLAAADWARWREDPTFCLEGGESFDEFDGLFKEDGHFIDPPAAWADPEDALSQSEFFEVMERCMEGLPKNTARVFVLREVLGTDTAEICTELSITSNNCWVLLYRARMALRECLQQRWFGAAT